MAPIAYAFLGGSFLVPYFVRFRESLNEALRRYGDDAIPYENIVTANAGLTAIMIFAKSDIRKRIQSVQTSGVGVGWWKVGNKGAVGVRLAYSSEDGNEAGMAFVAAHLAPMEYRLERRNLDWQNIVKGIVFQPTSLSKSTGATVVQAEGGDAEEEPLLSSTSSSGTQYTGLYHPKTNLFIAGDLNYRTRNTSPSNADHITYPQPTKDILSPSHWSHLLQSDQLTQELRAGHTLHGLCEAPITFPPTYKYSHNTAPSQNEIKHFEPDATWAWAQHRAPSWCDRILYLPASAVKVHKYTSLPLMSTSDHMPVALSLTLDLRPSASASVNSQGSEEEDVRIHPPFAINPNWSAARAAARRREIIIGVLAYLSLSWEGRSILLALVLGGLGGWAVIRSLLVR